MVRSSDPGASAGAVDVGLAMAAAGSNERATEKAATEAAERCAEGLRLAGGQSADLVLAFVSPHHAASIGLVGKAIARRMQARCIIGASAEAVINGFVEMEGAPGISLLAASLPGVSVRAFRSDDLPFGVGHAADVDQEEEEDLAALGQASGIGPGHRATIMFADPFSADMDTLLPAFARARTLCSAEGAGGGPDEPTCVGRRGPIMGGMASAAQRAGGNTLLVNDRVVRSGLVGVSLAGAVRCDAIVSQGCRPFGPNMVVTSARGNVIGTLSGRPALRVVHEAIEALGEKERQLLSRGLMIGRVVNEYKDRFGPGDYLIRAVTGVSKDTQAIAVADTFRVGQTVRLHLRDADTAERDLAMLMDAQSLHGRPAGVMLVTCNMRGTRLFAAPNHDAIAVQRAFLDPAASGLPGESKAKLGMPIGPRLGVPLAGFFAAAEIGPVGDGLFVHGQTACVLAFRPAVGG